jgi:hypothetical protein
MGAKQGARAAASKGREVRYRGKAEGQGRGKVMGSEQGWQQKRQRKKQGHGIRARDAEAPAQQATNTWRRGRKGAERENLVSGGKGMGSEARAAARGLEIEGQGRGKGGRQGRGSRQRIKT